MKLIESRDGTCYSDYGLFDQLTINDYAPGQGIPSHVDKHSPFEEIFTTLSLKSGVTMQFRRSSPDQDGKPMVKHLYLKPRSLVVFTGEARYNWLHGIACRKVDNIYSDKLN